jgi:hypothetical protein
VPATFPSHAGGILTLKVFWPRWIDGVALVVGAAMPDLAYVAGCCSPPQTYGHSWWGTIVAVPFTLAVGWLIRWAAPVVATHVPPLGSLALRDYGVLGWSTTGGGSVRSRPGSGRSAMSCGIT